MKPKEERGQRSGIDASNTPDPGLQWESDNVTLRHHKRDPRGQPFHQQVTTKHQQTDVHESITKDRNNIKDPHKKQRLVTVSTTILLECLNNEPSSPLVKMWIQTHRCFVCMKDP